MYLNSMTSIIKETYSSFFEALAEHINRILHVPLVHVLPVYNFKSKFSEGGSHVICIIDRIF